MPLLICTRCADQRGGEGGRGRGRSIYTIFPIGGGVLPRLDRDCGPVALTEGGRREGRQLRDFQSDLGSWPGGFLSCAEEDRGGRRGRERMSLTYPFIAELAAHTPSRFAGLCSIQKGGGERKRGRALGQTLSPRAAGLKVLAPQIRARQHRLDVVVEGGGRKRAA